MPEKSIRPRLFPATAAVCVASLLIPGCSSPLYERDTSELRRSIARAVGRELIEARTSPGSIELSRENRVEALQLKPEVMAELERMAGPQSYANDPAPLGPSLLPASAANRPAAGPDATTRSAPPSGVPPAASGAAAGVASGNPAGVASGGGGGSGGAGRRVATITLERAIRAAVANNLDVQFAQLTPAISQTRVVAAQAAFDWVFFNQAQWNNTDEPVVTGAIGNSPSGATANQREATTDTLGVRRKLVSGGTFTVQHSFTYTHVTTPGALTFPDPSYENAVVLQLDQPLLRNAGSDANLAQVRLNRNDERNEIQKLKQQLLKAASDTETAYWSLVASEYNLKILQRLLDEGISVQQKLGQRLGYDVPPSAYSDSVSKVETRRAQVIQAQRNLEVTSNQLKQLMNDPELTVGSEILVLPADDAIDAPVSFNLADAVILAIENRPEVQQALISIDNTSIRLQVAENGKLPLLDLRLQTRFSGLGAGTGSAYSSLTSSNFVDYLVSLNFEYPLGYREGEANYRQARLEQMQSTVAYRRAIQGIVQEVKNALTDVVMNYQLIGQRRAARYAAAENLRTVLVEEQNIRAFTTDFVDFKLRRQEELAQAEQNEISALTDYNTAIARLFGTMGTNLERNKIAFDAPDAPQLQPTNPLYPVYPWELPCP